mgnify:FL=1
MIITIVLILTFVILSFIIMSRAKNEKQNTIVSQHNLCYASEDTTAAVDNQIGETVKATANYDITTEDADSIEEITDNYDENEKDAENDDNDDDEEDDDDGIQYAEGTFERYLAEGRIRIKDNDPDVVEMRSRMSDWMERRERGEVADYKIPENNYYPLQLSDECTKAVGKFYASQYQGTFSFTFLYVLKYLHPNVYASSVKAIGLLSDEIIWFDSELEKNRVCSSIVDSIKPQRTFVSTALHEDYAGCRDIDIGRACYLKENEKLLLVHPNKASKQLCLYSQDGCIVGYLTAEDSSFIMPLIDDGIGLLWVSSVELAIEGKAKKRIQGVKLGVSYDPNKFLPKDIRREQLIVSQPQSSTNPFMGKVVVVNGTFREMFKYGAQLNVEALLGRYGARISKALISSADFLVVGDAMAQWVQQQLRDFKEKGISIPVISQEELNKNHSGNE